MGLYSSHWDKNWLFNKIPLSATAETQNFAALLLGKKVLPLELAASDKCFVMPK